MHYYQFNIGDYKSHTDHLTNLEDLGYRRLLDWLYLHEKPLPLDESKAARLVRMGENQAEISTVLQEFFTKTSDGWVHNRVSLEIEDYRLKQAIARANGKKGGRPKSTEKPNKTHSVNLANQEESGLQTNHKPITNNQEPRTNNQVLKHNGASQANAQEFATRGFNRIWVYFPTKKNKKKALSLFIGYVKKNKLDAMKFADQLIDDIQKRVQVQQLGFDAMHFTTYLNGERWNDDYSVKQTKEDLRRNAVDQAAQDFINGDF